MTSRTALPCPTQDVNPLGAQHLRALDTPYLVVTEQTSVCIIRLTVTAWQSLCSSNPFYLIMAPKRKVSDPGHSDMPKRSRKMPSLRESVCMYVQKRPECIYI